MPPVSTWRQNAPVTAVINADQFTPAEFACLNNVFENYNNAAGVGGNSSGVRFNVTYSSTAVATLNGPYTSGESNLAVNSPGVTNGLQVNRPQGMRPQAMGEEYIGTDGARRNSAVILLNPNITDCTNMAQVLAHEVGHTFGLADCCGCPRASTVMNCGVCAEVGADANGNRTCVRADYNNSSNGRSSPTTCDDASIQQSGQYDPLTVNQPPPTLCMDGDGDGWYTCGESPDCNDADGNFTDDCSGCGDFERHDAYDCYTSGGVWKTTPDCFCDYPFQTDPGSPVLVDVNGDGFRLTDAAGGVLFDIDGDGVRERLSWTAPGSDDAWLALDRNGNGFIESGRELFGNFTPQPESASKNGFIALAEYDKAENGGNEDGVIDGRDPVFPSLRLWRDANHNGVSEPGELRALPSLDLARLHVRYKYSKRTDEHGNEFRYRAKVDDARRAKVNRWAWDVFLVKGQ